MTTDDDKKPSWNWRETSAVVIDGAHVGMLRSRRHVDGYAWDEWERRAQAAGLGADLAALGRAVMREADQHAWSEELQAECGWSDAGEAMIALALAGPDVARARWAALLETDGGYLDGDGYGDL